MTRVGKHLTFDKQKQACSSSKVKESSCLERMSINSSLSALLITNVTANV